MVRAPFSISAVHAGEMRRARPPWCAYALAFFVSAMAPTAVSLAAQLTAQQLRYAAAFDAARALRIASTTSRDASGLARNDPERLMTRDIRSVDTKQLEVSMRPPVDTSFLHYLELITTAVLAGSICLIVWNRGLRARVSTKTTELNDALLSLRQAVSAGNVGLFDWDLRTQHVRYSTEWKRQIGYADDEIAGDIGEWENRVHPEDRERALSTVHAYIEHPWPDYQLEFRFRHKDGSYRWILAHAALQLDERGKPVRMLGSHVDITRRKQNEALCIGQSEVLELIAANMPYAKALAALLRVIESQFPGMLCSILLLDSDGTHVRHIAAPSLPADFVRAIDGESIGPCAGSCGTAMYRREPVIVEDIETDPLWAEYRDLARDHGLRACWSTPIFDSQRRVLGSFAIYFRAPGRPNELHGWVIAMATHTAAIAIEKHREQKVLRNNEEQLRLSVSAANLGTWHRDMVTGEITASEACRAMLGLPPDAKSTYEELLATVHPAERAATDAAVRRAIAERSACDLETRILRHDGTERWVAVRGRAYYDVDGRPTAMEGIVFDIHERKRAEVALRRSEAQLRLFVEYSPAAIAMFDREMRYLAVSRRWLSDYGLGDQDLRGRSHYEVFPEIPERWKEIHRRCLAGTVEQCDEDPFPRTDGHTDWVRWEIHPWRDYDGGIGGIVMFTEVITARKQAEEKVERLNRVYAMLSGINSVIVRVRDWQELFREACRLAVVAGKFRFAWIGLLEPDVGRIRAIVEHGADREFSRKLEAQIRQDATEARGLVWRAVRQKRPMISNNLESETTVVLMRDELMARGVRAVAVFPLMVSGEAAGMFALHAAEVGAFNEAEVNLLSELAGDVAFGLDHIRKEERIDYLAYYDSLTNLANQTLFHERLTQFLHAAQRDRGRLALYVIDLDRFRNVNDALGRQFGDALLAEFAARLERHVDDSSQVARLGADRFAVVLPEIDNEAGVGHAIEHTMAQCVDVPFRLARTELRLAAKAGVALYPEDGIDGDALFRNAEAALTKAKIGGERYLFYRQEMTERVGEKLALESKLRHALGSDQFVLHYQPKVDSRGGRVVGLEALLRWNDPARGLRSPKEFIPVLEETGLILDVGRWVLRQALADYQHWPSDDSRPPQIAVNVSAIQLRQRDFAQVICDAVAAAGVEARMLELELTESLIMEDIEANYETLRRLSDMGVKITIDDFGTGYSSLRYLAKLPVDAVKIDRSFIDTMVSEAESRNIVTTIISLAHSLNITVVAEGVESEEQFDLLRGMKCDEMQGYLFGRPLAAPEIGGALDPWHRSKWANRGRREVRPRRVKIR